jgi:hypothetical protein
MTSDNNLRHADQLVISSRARKSGRLKETPSMIEAAR